MRRRSMSSEINPSFIKELEQLINKYSLENGSNTPDLILAGYLTDCLTAFNKSVNYRQNWFTLSNEINEMVVKNGN